ncbi:MAG: hypothetical protein WAV23_00055 [Minisyncoccia bacterium]
MFRFIAPAILIGVAATGFFMFTIPFYGEITSSKAEVLSYNEALDNSKILEAKRDELTAKLNTIDPNNLVRLQKLLPDSVDNIRLILEIEQISKPYGMVLKDVKYDAVIKEAAAQTSGAVQGGVASTEVRKDYGTWNLEFSTQGTYSNFINFVKDLESNLRIVDISSIQFSSDTPGGASALSLSNPSDSYKYGFKIKTYWLKN